MPLGEIAGEIAGAVFRFVGYILIDVVLEFGIRGLGYAIGRRFSKSVNVDGVGVLVVGFMAWIAIIAVGVFVFSFIQESLAVDSCLDSGGKFDYENGRCVRGA